MTPHSAHSHEPRARDLESALPAGAALRHDAEARARLEQMIARDYRMLWRLLRRLGVSAADVDDATQQVFLIAAERLADIRAESERSFLYGTALRVAQSFRRRDQRGRAEVEHESVAAKTPDAEALVAQRRAREQLDRVLEALPLELRSVFVLFELEGMTAPEIAALSELPLGTVASRLRRARERFRVLCTALPALEATSKDVP